jgi:hypothetical protein
MAESMKNGDAMGNEDDDDMPPDCIYSDPELAYVRNPTGATMDRGRIIIDGPFSGEPYMEPWLNSPAGSGLWRGRQLAPRERPVLVTYSFVDDFSRRELNDTWIRYDAVGIAPLIYFGYLDGVASLDEEMFRHLRKRGIHPHMAMAEARPLGKRLLSVSPLSVAEVVRLGLGLCDTLLLLGERGVVGLRPETVYVTGEPGNRHYAGAAPRAFLLGGYSPGEGWLEASFDPPTPSMYDRDIDEVVYTVALLLWFGLLREHAFIFGTNRDEYDNMWRDVRAPFSGPPELGRLLEAVLVSDVEKRMRTAELREELAKLAARWNIEPPPFPPPGLA